MSNKTIKVALAGAGAFGIKHLDGIKNIDGVEVVSLVAGVMCTLAYVVNDEFDPVPWIAAGSRVFAKRVCGRSRRDHGQESRRPDHQFLHARSSEASPLRPT